jgi:transposase
MRLITRLVLRHRARQSVLNALRFAERLRKQNSEFAPSYSDTINSIGDELATMSRDACRNDAERRALLAGLLSAFQRMYRGNPALAQRITRRLAPRILNLQSAHEPASAWMRIAV